MERLQLEMWEGAVSSLRSWMGAQLSSLERKLMEELEGREELGAVVGGMEVVVRRMESRMKGIEERIEVGVKTLGDDLRVAIMRG